MNRQARKVQLLQVALLSLLASTTCLVTIPAQVQAAEAGDKSGLVWETDLDKALSEAKSASKYVLVDVYTDWCGWCKRLDKDVYSKPKVIDYLNKGYVCVKINGDDKGSGARFAKKYNVNGYPTIIVLNADGSLRGSRAGFVPASAFASTIDGVAQGKAQ